MTEKIGPVQLVAIGFPPDAEFEGRIMDELARLESHETIRILDLLFVGKDAETGDLIALDYQGEDLGAIVGALLGFEFEDGGELEGGPKVLKATSSGSHKARYTTWPPRCALAAPLASSSSSTCGRAI
jgi:hypothetical protein